MKTRKYSYLFVLQGNYGYGHGWEDLTAEEIEPGQESKARRAIRQTRREYDENEGGTYRIVRRRELIEGRAVA